MELPFHICDSVMLKKWGVRLFTVTLLGLIIWWWLHDPKASWQGTPAPDAPAQTTGGLPEPFDHDGYKITPLAHYTITAIVLSRSRYRSDEMAEICPLDLALGWGPISQADNVNALKIGQAFRYYHWRISGEDQHRQQLPLRVIETHSANTHCVPATEWVREDLLSIKRHDLVTLKGYLIRAVKGKRSYNSSMLRTDTGGGACEVLYVTEVTRSQP